MRKRLGQKRENWSTRTPRPEALSTLAHRVFRRLQRKKRSLLLKEELKFLEFLGAGARQAYESSRWRPELDTIFEKRIAHFKEFMSMITKYHYRNILIVLTH